MNLEELKERIDKIHNLLSDPQPGLFTWCQFLGEQMNELCSEWNKKDETI